MEKPITVRHEEFKQGLASYINNSGLPPFVIEAILQNYLNEIKMLANQQYQFDKQAYDHELTLGADKPNTDSHQAEQ